ncbi:hypothetical protein L6164_030571 [Bauhinia variegata]|uniref:Uncharacterized protein n=1 Tax=Bauhinia variegata TaxID=167791 RepID=A0ACB9LD21_BAUVA|nr:hypothetical protein L6164_030571 [Bauhinia variegata]
MAEREPPPLSSSQTPLRPPLPPHISGNQNQITIHPVKQAQLELPDLNKSTYVVQFPRDQVYRVPTPENARVTELHRNPPKDDKKRRRCICFVVFSVLVAIAVLLVAVVIGGLFPLLHNNKDPRFSIQRFLLNSKNKAEEYGISLRVDNPNPKVGILYKEGGSVSLSLRQQEIASGSYPSFYQGHGDSKVFGITLKGSKSSLHDEKSMKNDKSKVDVALSLSIHVQTQMKMGFLHNATMKYEVTCQVTVDTLAKGTTRILSQKCQAKRS